MVALEEALHEITRMADLVASLLTLARADEGRFDLHREPVALEPLVHEVFETAVILGEDGGLAVTMPALEPAVVRGDATRLRQMFLNLAMNAVKYTGRGGSVEIALTRAGRMINFSVRDTGIGIAAADLPHVFERFYRAGGRTRLDGGTGLGLAIAKHLVQAHGGQIGASSVPGQGATFFFTLPEAGTTEAAA
jgi:signal transduction histidine kinase